MEYKRKYRPLTKKQRKIFKAGWKQMASDYDYFLKLMRATQRWMRKESGIKDVEFFVIGEGIVGIGNISGTIKLLRDKDLERK